MLKLFIYKDKNMILDKIDELLKEVSNLSAKNAEDVERLRLKYLSKKVGAYACEQLFKRHSQAVIASEFRYMHPHLDEKTLVIIISQSGETADTLAAMRIAQEKGAKVIGIVNVENSTIAQECKNVVLTKAGREIAVATTKAYSAQLAVVYALAIRLAEADGAISRREAADLVDVVYTKTT